MSWSPDGCNIAVTGSFETHRPDFTNSIQIFSTLTGNIQAVLTGLRGPAIGPVYSDDGRMLLCGGWTDQIGIWDVCNGTQLLGLPQYTTNLKMDNRSQQFSFLGGDDLQFWQLNTSRECRLFDTVLAGRAILTADMSADGKLIAGATNVGVRLWDVASGKPCGLLSAPGARTVLFTPDGKRLLASTVDGVRSWNLADIARRNDPVTEPADEAATCGMAMDDAGHTLIFGAY